MRATLLLIACCGAASAHVISMSNGYAAVNGDRVDYLLRMPDYELPASGDPATLLLDRIRFTSGFETARRIDGECHHDADARTWLCAAAYGFAAPPEKIVVECTFYEVTVPNHIHMLHAERGGKSDQAILDSAFSSAPLLFRPPTAFEQAALQSFAAAKRVLTTWVHWLLLIALALAARTRRELIILAAAFLAAQCLACLALLHRAWQPPPVFAECAVALALAYLAFEMLVFPASGLRWVLATVFGAFSGAYFARFISESAFRTVWVLAGSAVVPMAVLAITVPLLRARANHPRISRAAAVPLLSIGCLWFALRLFGR